MAVSICSLNLEIKPMPLITISFDYPDAPLPQFKFGDAIAVTDKCAPKDWLTGKVVGLILEEETCKPRWWYAIKLNNPQGFTEEYLGDDLVLEEEISTLQFQWEQEAVSVFESVDSTVEIHQCVRSFPLQ